MSTFRTEMEIVLDGEVFKCRTSALDHTNAELMTAKDGGNIETRQVSQGFHVAYCTFRRCHPEAELSRSYGRFIEVLDEVRNLEEAEGAEDEPNPLDPTPPADGADWR
jgi:hypothetical protein